MIRQQQNSYLSSFINSIFCCCLLTAANHFGRGVLVEAPDPVVNVVNVLDEYLFLKYFIPFDTAIIRCITVPELLREQHYPTNKVVGNCIMPI